MLDTIFLIAAVVGGTVMVCQFVLTLMGLGDHGVDGGHGGFGEASHTGFDLDAGDVHGGDFHGADVHGHAGGDAAHDHHHTTVATAADGQIAHPDSSWLFGVLSFRTLVTAAAFFGLSGMAALRSGFSPTKSILVATAAGFAAMYGMYWLMRGISSLNASGNQRIGNALGRRGTVYIPIPGENKGAGKVQLSMQNRIVEFLAVTDETDRRGIL